MSNVAHPGALACALLALFSTAGSALAEDSADLAKKLTNPVAALISVPFQLNYDRGIGPVHDGDRLTMNFQPVVPISLNEDWNLISRTILPVHLPVVDHARLGIADRSWRHPAERLLLAEAADGRRPHLGRRPGSPARTAGEAGR